MRAVVGWSLPRHGIFSVPVIGIDSTGCLRMATADTLGPRKSNLLPPRGGDWVMQNVGSGENGFLLWLGCLLSVSIRHWCSPVVCTSGRALLTV